MEELNCHDELPCRTCSCRGDNAGFVHLKCLSEYARTKMFNNRSSDVNDQLTPWKICGLCKQMYHGQFALDLIHECESCIQDVYGEQCLLFELIQIEKFVNLVQSFSDSPDIDLGKSIHSLYQKIQQYHYYTEEHGLGRLKAIVDSKYASFIFIIEPMSVANACTGFWLLREAYDCICRLGGGRYEDDKISIIQNRLFFRLNCTQRFGFNPCFGHGPTEEEMTMLEKAYMKSKKNLSLIRIANISLMVITMHCI